jgi:hypothetical protein
MNKTEPNNLRLRFEAQKTFFNRMKKEYGDKPRDEKIKDYCLGIHKNVSDVINALDWDLSKERKTNSELYQEVEIVDAAIDIINYSFNLLIEYGVEAEKLNKLMMRKNRSIAQKLDQRQFMRSTKFYNSKYAFVIDIDGVIADVVSAYKDWFGEKAKIVFNHFNDFNTWRIKNIDLYKELKEEYRLSGHKTKIPTVEGTEELLKICHEKGIVSLLSNRPVKTYPIIYEYTIEWLHNYDLYYYVDMIHFTDLGEKRYFFDRFSGKEVYFLEDNVYNIINTNERPNVCNIFIRNETNEDVPNPLDAITASGLDAALELIKVMTHEENNDIK